MRGAPFTVPAAYGGIDRGNPPDIDPAGIIYQRSNFDFLGHYLSHNPKGIDDPKRWVNWKPFLPKFLKQGWGVLFLYNAKNQGDVGNQFTEVDARDPVGLAREHAGIAKTLAADLGHESQGAVVFVDNEDHFTTLEPAFRDYITTLFEELGKPGAGPGDPPPVRAGFYVRADPARLILDYSPNVVLWFTDNNKPPEKGFPYSYSQAYDQGSLITPIGEWPISALKYGIDQKRTALFLGRQWMFYDEKGQDIHVYAGKPKQKVRVKIEGLDFDTSLVRDPRYPVAQPRIVAWEDITLRTFFSKTDLSMHVERVRGGTSLPTLLQRGAKGDDLLEPEAPLILVVETYIDQGPDVAGPHPELFTLCKAGLPVSFKAARAQGNPEGWTWSPPTRIVSDSVKLVLRRNRAMTAVKRSPTDTQVFFVSETHILMGVRRLADDTWTVPMPLAASEPLHWFSNITAVARDDVSVDIFYIDRENRIHTAWWPSKTTQTASQEPTPTPWPSSFHQALPLLSTADQTSPILPSTSLAAVSPSRDTILVFAVGNDHALYMASFNANSGWAPLSAIGPQLPKTTPSSAPERDLPTSNSADEPLLFPHTQLSVLAVSDAVVYVAAIMEINVPCIYRITLAQGDTTWKFSERFQCPNTPPAPVPKGSNPIAENPGLMEGSAAAYRFNPFGDVVLQMQGLTPVLWVAGVTEDKGVVGKSGEKPEIGIKGDDSGLAGRTGGNRGLLFAKVKRNGMVWMLMK